MTIIGYARVSTREQNPQSQEAGLCAAGVARVFTDHGERIQQDRFKIDEFGSWTSVQSRPGAKLQEMQGSCRRTWGIGKSKLCRSSWLCILRGLHLLVCSSHGGSSEEGQCEDRGQCRQDDERIEPPGNKIELRGTWTGHGKYPVGVDAAPMLSVDGVAR